ncbi:hypothetical protein ACJIZ3_006290 [Penstemon smallii]|uniref:Uncharacterized protein n=1 Tax=Penstemon smallii TaxID=265156 RepID=A0ABD3S7B3_9LAMI
MLFPDSFLIKSKYAILYSPPQILYRIAGGSSVCGEKLWHGRNWKDFCRTSRGAIGDFGLKGIVTTECAHFPRSLIGSSIQPIDLSANDEDALIVSPISIHGDISNSEADAPPFEEVNPLAIVLYEGPSDGADDNVNGGGLIAEPQGCVFFFFFANELCN